MHAVSNAGLPIIPTTSSTETARSSQTSSHHATRLPLGQGPLSAEQIDSIARVQQNPVASSPLRSRASSVVSGVATSHASDQLSAQGKLERTTLRNLLQNHEASALALMVQHFKLEGAVLQQTLGEAACLEMLSGVLLQQAIAGSISEEMKSLLAESTLYEHINRDEETPVPTSVTAEQLGTCSDNASDMEQACHRLTVLDSAYKQTLNSLQQQNPCDTDAVQKIQLSQIAFKIGIAVKEHQLGAVVIEFQIQKETASNKMLLVTTPEGRANASGLVTPLLEAAKVELQTFTKNASNFILKEEHLADHQRRAIQSTDGWQDYTAKLANTLVAAGLPQGISSTAHWGYVRNTALQAAGIALREQFSSPGGMIASAIIQGAMLGIAHKLVSDGPRELLSTLAEAAGARPTELVPAGIYYPDAPRAIVGDAGQIHMRTDSELGHENAEPTSQRAVHTRQANDWAFGTPKGDWAGFGAFGSVNAVRDGLTTLKVEQASSLSGRAGFSGLGGTLMSTTQAVGQLTHRVDGMPTHVLANQSNPRTASQRLSLAVQKLDLTVQGNRMDLYSKITSASVGIALSGALGATASTALETIADKATSLPAGIAAKTAHAVVEGMKSYFTLQPFFGGLVAGSEAAKIGGNRGVLAKRMILGMENVRHPNRAGAAHIEPEGTLGYTIETAHIGLRGGTQLFTQTAAVGLEVAGQMLNTSARGIGGGMSAAAQRIATAMMPQRPPPDDLEMQQPDDVG